MGELWQSFGNTIVNILPKSPFLQYIQPFAESQYIAWLNWFIPFGDIIVIFGSWLGCVAVFYLAQIVLRWVKVIQG